MIMQWADFFCLGIFNVKYEILLCGGKGGKGNNGKGKMCEKKWWERENLRKQNVKVEK